MSNAVHMRVHVSCACAECVGLGHALETRFSRQGDLHLGSAEKIRGRLSGTLNKV
jgi:hypothetical protein